MKQFLALVGFVIASITTGCGQSHTVWLDDLDLTAMTQGNGVAMKNKSVDGKTLTIGGQTFERGVGTHSVSEIAIQLDGKAVSFTAQVGLDDEIIEHKTSAEFVVIGDGARLWSSGIVKAGDAPKLCSVSLDGVKRLELIVADGGDGPYYDHADWADAKIISKGKKSFPTLKFIATEPYILTPPAPATPRINGAFVFGVRPGSPFQYQIAATGDRPMTFAAEGLPAGLEIHPETGLITGKLTRAGTFEVVLQAKNVKGTAERKLRIECGDRIALTPPMGWNSWNCFGHEVSAEKVKQAARAMVESGLVNYGWTYINIDDSWQHHRDPNDRTRGGRLRDDQGNIIPNAQFPDMKGLTDYIHSLGLKVGIYSSPGPWTCGGCVGSYGYEKQDADMYGKWGFDYLKYDWCSYGGVLDRDLDKDPYSVSSLAFQGGGDSIAGRKPFKIMGDYLRQQPRDIVYNLCQYGMGDVWKWGDDVGGQCWRTTNAHSVRHFLLSLQIMRNKFVQRRIEQTNSYRTTFHSLEDTLKVSLLVRQYLGQSLATSFRIFCEDHLTHSFNFFTFKKHMFRTAKTDTYSTKVASYAGIMGSICIGTYLKFRILISQIHQFSKIS